MAYKNKLTYTVINRSHFVSISEYFLDNHPIIERSMKRFWKLIFNSQNLSANSTCKFGVVMFHKVRVERRG